MSSRAKVNIRLKLGQCILGDEAMFCLDRGFQVKVKFQTIDSKPFGLMLVDLLD